MSEIVHMNPDEPEPIHIDGPIPGDPLNEVMEVWGHSVLPLPPMPPKHLMCKFTEKEILPPTQDWNFPPPEHYNKEVKFDIKAFRAFGPPITYSKMVEEIGRQKDEVLDRLFKESYYTTGTSGGATTQDISVESLLKTIEEGQEIAAKIRTTEDRIILMLKELRRSKVGSSLCDYIATLVGWDYFRRVMTGEARPDVHFFDTARKVLEEYHNRWGVPCTTEPLRPYPR